MLQLAAKPKLTQGRAHLQSSLQDNVFIFRLDSKRKSLVSVDQLSGVFTVETCIVSLTCVPRLKPWPVILLAVNFVMILLLQFLRFPPVQGDSDPRSVAIISSSWTELFGQEVEGFDELLEAIKRHLLAEKHTPPESRGFNDIFILYILFIMMTCIIIPRKYRPDSLVFRWLYFAHLSHS